MPDYRWLGNPNASAAPEAVVSDMAELARQHEQDLAVANLLQMLPERYFQMLEDGHSLEQMLEERHITPANYQTFIDNLNGRLPPEIQSETVSVRFEAAVEFATGRQILQVRGALDKGFRKWATDARNSRLYRYHRAEFETFEEMMQRVFEDLPEDSTTRFDATFIADELYPFAVKYHIDHADRVWGDGTIEKARAAVPLLRGLIRQGDVAPADVAQVQAIVSDVLELTGTEFKAKYKPMPAEAEELVITDYVGPNGGTLVIEYHSPLQRLGIERRLGGGEWHHGTGNEPVLERLARIESKARRRRKPASPLKKVKPRGPRSKRR